MKTVSTAAPPAPPREQNKPGVFCMAESIGSMAKLLTNMEERILAAEHALGIDQSPGPGEQNVTTMPDADGLLQRTGAMYSKLDRVSSRLHGVFAAIGL